jgi:excisionase family DNA binding protein
MTDATENTYTVSQVAERLGVSEESVRRWLREGLLGGLAAGRKWVVPAGELQAFLETNTRRRLGRYTEVERAVPFR